MPSVIIVGGGMAGCGAALRLAEAGYAVTFLEGRGELLLGSSGATPCRVGLGFHYPDKSTAIRALKNAVRFVRAYKNVGIQLRVGEDKPLDHPLRRGHYYITKDSQFSVEHVLSLYDGLKEAYADLIKENPENEVFGPAENFYKVLWKESDETAKEQQDALSDLVSHDKVACALETAEHSLNWSAFQSYFIDKIMHHPNIRVLLNTEVKEITPDRQQHCYVVKTKAGEETADFVINSSWYNIEALNKTAGVKVDPENRTLRVKVIIKIKLPEALLDKPSAFFCFGPHCSLTNTGDGYGWLSYEPVTNIGASNKLNLDPELKALVEGHVTDAQKEEFGRKIIAGASQYIPELSQAEYKATKIGVVRTLGKKAPINDPNSAIHNRDYLGVQAELLG